jgi:undecaprenyl-diphosphatase
MTGSARVLRTLRHLARPLAVLLVASIASAAAFTALAEEMAEQEMAQLDAIGGAWATAARSPAMDVFFQGATQGGSVYLLVPICLLAAWHLRQQRARRIVGPVLLAPIVAASLTGTLKVLFRRQRPAGGLVHAMGASFPSGHTTAATAVAFSLAYVLVRERLAPKSIALVAAVYALLVGASRIYLGAHWSSDVLGGWAIGATIAAACGALYERARELEQTTG